MSTSLICSRQLPSPSTPDVLLSLPSSSSSRSHPSSPVCSSPAPTPPRKRTARLFPKCDGARSAQQSTKDFEIDCLLCDMRY
eukprot:3574461-Rhodomonas_salina.2